MGDASLLIFLPGSHLYGQENALITLAQVLRARGVPIHFLVHGSWGRRITERLDEFGFGWTPLPLNTIWSLSLARRDPMLPIKNLLGVVGSSIKLLRVIQEVRGTHLLTGNATFSFYLLPALLASNISLIYRHGDEATEHSFVHRILNRLLFRRANIHVANCMYLKDRLVPKHVDLDVKVIYNMSRSMQGVEPRSRPRIERGDQAVEVLFVGQLAVHKGVHLLLEAFSNLVAKYPRLRLRLVGDIPGIGYARDESIGALLQHAISRMPNNIVFSGRVNDVGALFETAQIHVCPSVYAEPSANVILEAKAHGIPSVVFRVGGLPELITHEEDGIICAEISAAALADGIERLVSDSRLRSSMSDAALRNHQNRFGGDRFADSWLEVIRSSSARGTARASEGPVE